MTIILRQLALGGGVTPPPTPVLARARQEFLEVIVVEQEFSMPHVVRQTIAAVYTVEQDFEVKP